jgi:transcription antitermination factor NusA-like protein
MNDISPYFSLVNHVQLTAYITSASVGAVIGRKGARIVQIQKDSGKQVRVNIVSTTSGKVGAATTVNSKTNKESKIDEVDIETPGGERDRNDDGVSNELEQWVPVIIKGDPVGTIKAGKLVLEALEDPQDMDGVVMDVPLHRSKHSAIIGKKGINIMKLSSDHNVRIMVPPPTRDNTEKGNLNMIQLEGDIFDVEKCLVDLLKTVTSPPPNSTATTNSSSSLSHDTEMTMPPDIPGVKVTLLKNQIKVMISPELSHIVPSLTRLRSIGKSHNALIRRKRVVDNNGSTCEDESESEESDKEIEEEVPPTSSKVATLLIITPQNRKSRDESIKMKCYIELHKILQGESLTSTDQDPDHQNYNIVTETDSGGTKIRNKQRYLRGSKRKGIGRSSAKVDP